MFNKAMACAFLLTSMNAYSGMTLKQTICPALTDDSTAIITSIQVLQDQIQSKDECKAISEKLNNLGKVVQKEQWKNVKNLFKTSDAPALEGEEIEELSTIVQEASQNISEVVGILNGNGSTCISSKDKPTFLSNLSGIVREVSGVIGNVTGPYGMAVNLSGNLLSSAIIGIDNVFNNRSYNFSKIEEELLFMNQYCSFSEIQKDINDYLGLATRKEELEILASYLDIKIQDIKEHCPECEGYDMAWTTREASNKVVGRIGQDANIIAIGADMNNHEYTRCKEMHRAFHTGNSDFMQFMDILGNYDNPMSTQSDKELIEEIVLVSKDLKDIYPSFKDCVNLNNSEKVAISHDFNNLMRDEILPLNNEIFTQQMNGFEFAANRKFKYPLGEYIAKSLDRKKWIAVKRDMVNSKLNDPNYSVSTEKIRETKRELEERFVKDIMPDYLSFMTKRNLSELKSFSRSYKKFKRQMMKNYNVASFEELKELLSANGSDNRVFIAEESRIMEKLKLSLDQSKTFARYCEYLKYMMNATLETETICSRKKNELQEEYQYLADSSERFANLITQAKLWEKADAIIQNSRVSEYSNNIFNWNERGESKWCLKADTRPLCEK